MVAGCEQFAAAETVLLRSVGIPARLVTGLAYGEGRGDRRLYREKDLHAWVEVGDWWQTQADLMQGGKEALDAAGIEIPFPHQVAVPYGDENVVPVVRVQTIDDREKVA